MPHAGCPWIALSDRMCRRGVGAGAGVQRAKAMCTICSERVRGEDDASDLLRRPRTGAHHVRGLSFVDALLERGHKAFPHVPGLYFGIKTKTVPLYVVWGHTAGNNR